MADELTPRVASSERNAKRHSMNASDIGRLGNTLCKRPVAQVQRHRYVGGRASCGHACHAGIFTPCDVILAGDHGGQGASAYGVPLPAPRH